MVCLPHQSQHHKLRYYFAPNTRIWTESQNATEVHCCHLFTTVGFSTADSVWLLMKADEISQQTPDESAQETGEDMLARRTVFQSLLVSLLTTGVIWNLSLQAWE